MCGLSGGADSTALVALAVAAGLVVEAVHVDHGLRPGSSRDADVARRSAERLGASFRCVRVDVGDGANLEERARDARLAALGEGAMTGHTADDQAETVVLALLRGAGARGLGAMRRGPTHPLLDLRRSETRGLCGALGLEVVDDPTNADPRRRRNRVRAEVLPLLADVAARDAAVPIARAADLLRDDDALLEALAADLDPTDVRALVAAPLPLARRAVRRWLAVAGRPPDAAAVARVLAVADGSALACEVTGVGRVERSRGRLRVVGAPRGRARAGFAPRAPRG